MAKIKVYSFSIQTGVPFWGLDSKKVFLFLNISQHFICFRVRTVWETEINFVVNFVHLEDFNNATKIDEMVKIITRISGH